MRIELFIGMLLEPLMKEIPAPAWAVIGVACAVLAAILWLLSKRKSE